MRWLIVVLLVAACGGPKSTGGKPGETAAERAKREYEASGEADLDRKNKRWKGWQYTGARDECFFVVGRRCFTEEKAACKAARCGKQGCRSDGAGPATVSCKK